MECIRNSNLTAICFLTIILISSPLSGCFGNDESSQSQDDQTIGELIIFNDDGMNWDWVPITENSTEDNIRPIVPDWDNQNTAVIWLQGTYDHYTDYNLKVVGVIISE